MNISQWFISDLQCLQIKQLSSLAIAEELFKAQNSVFRVVVGVEYIMFLHQ